MKPIPDKTGRFAYRPYYGDGEIDDLCETAITEYLERAGGMTIPIPTERLKTLIERDADEFDEFADLSCHGDDVEGVTLFNPGKKPTVHIALNLSNSPGRQHRLRTTLAHEWGHVALHNNPFQAKYTTASLFDLTEPETAKCKREAITGSSTDWIEWQAGRVCGALLMPRTFLLACVQKYCDDHHCHGRIIDGTGYPMQLAQHISNIFHVSEDAAKVRIRQLNIVKARSENIEINFS